MSMNELRAIATFAKAVELGSLRQAALAQGVSPQAASQSLAQLEDYLGVRLLNRTTRNISLTDEGKQFLESAQPALTALERALHKIRNDKDEIAGQLRIVGPRTSFLPVIAALLDEFCKKHPDIQADVHLDDRIGNWVEDRVDVGFRSGYPPEGGVVARRLLSLQLIVCASPAYIARHGAPTCIADLAQHRCSGFRHAATGKPMPWEFQVGDDIVALGVGLRDPGGAEVAEQGQNLVLRFLEVLLEERVALLTILLVRLIHGLAARLRVARFHHENYVGRNQAQCLQTGHQVVNGAVHAPLR